MKPRRRKSGHIKFNNIFDAVGGEPRYVRPSDTNNHNTNTTGAAGSGVTATSATENRTRDKRRRQRLQRERSAQRAGLAAAAEAEAPGTKRDRSAIADVYNVDGLFAHGRKEVKCVKVSHKHLESAETWTSEEDTIVRQVVGKYGPNWDLVAHVLALNTTPGIHRSAANCQKRYSVLATASSTNRKQASSLQKQAVGLCKVIMEANDARAKPRPEKLLQPIPPARISKRHAEPAPAPAAVAPSNAARATGGSRMTAQQRAQATNKQQQQAQVRMNRQQQLAEQRSRAARQQGHAQAQAQQARQAQQQQQAQARRELLQKQQQAAQAAQARQRAQTKQQLHQQKQQQLQQQQHARAQEEERAKLNQAIRDKIVRRMVRGRIGITYYCYGGGDIVMYAFPSLPPQPGQRPLKVATEKISHVTSEILSDAGVPTYVQPLAFGASTDKVSMESYAGIGRSPDSHFQAL